MRATRLYGILALALFTAACEAAPPAQQTPESPAAAEAADVVVYLVRHAEKVDDSRDPDLSEAGHARAGTLAHVLADAGVTHVHSTDYIRTRDTAAPAAAALGIDVSLYDPRDLDAFAATLAATPGRHLVVGHSNTTPALVSALGGDAGDAIDEAGEYDRLYVVVLGGGEPRTLLLRYGSPYGG